METTITFEQIKPLFERAEQIAIAKYGSEPRFVQLQEDGEFKATWYSNYNGGEDDYEYIAFSEVLDADLDKLVAERLAKEEIQRKLNEERQRENEQRRKEQLEREEKQTYERLKKKFEV